MSEFRASAPSAEAVFYRSYSRRKEDGSRENFEQAMTRTVSAIAEIGGFTDEQRQLVLSMALKQHCFPSGRSLWVAGTEWSKKPDNFPGFYNCCSMHTDEVSIFGLLMQLAMMGTGTGAVLEQEAIDKLPEVRRGLHVTDVILNQDKIGGKSETSIEFVGIEDENPIIHLTVGDSRQGWATAYEGLIKLASGEPANGEEDDTTCVDAKVILDLSQVRQAGEPLKGFGGKANPIRLETTMLRVASILTGAVGRKLNSVECCLIIDEAASAVVAGNIRRCLPEDSLVHTSKGLVPIKDVNIGDMVQTPIGFRSVVNKFDQGVQEVVELETNGPKPRATMNHRIAIFDDAKGSVKWVKIADLKENDRLMHSNQILPGKATSLPADFTAERPVGSHTAKQITIPELDTDIAWLIGFTHGDGCVQIGRNKHGKSYGMISWSTNSSNQDESSQIAAKIQRGLSRFGVHAVETQSKDDNTLRLVCSSIRLAEYFYEYIKKPKTSIRVPDFILQGTAEIRAAYLAGIVDSDGAVNNRPPHLVTTVYQSFARQLAAVTSSLGIACRTSIVRPVNDSWKIKYNLTIPALKAKYNSIIAQFSAKGKLKEGLKMNGFTLPNAMMRESYSYSEMSDMGFTGAVAKSSNYETYVKASDVDIDIPVTFNGIGSVDVVQTYDIEVEEAHCFYCDGYLTHNSAGMRQFSSSDTEAATAKDGLYKQDENGKWSVDPEKEALRMANHTRCYHEIPSFDEVKDAVTKQFWSGEGAIQYVPEAVARANADILPDASSKSLFLKVYTQQGRDAAKEFLAEAQQKITGTLPDERELNHRMDRYGLNPCGEILMRDNLCNLSEIHLNTIDPKDRDLQYKAFYAGGLQVAALLQHKFVPERLAYSRQIDPIVGVSFTGLFDFFVHAFGSGWLRWMMKGRPGGKDYANYTNKEKEYLITWRTAAERAVRDYCEEHGIKCPNRFTTVQPAGSKSLLTGASPGWHPPKSQRFIRRITFGKDDPLVSALRDYGYTVIPAQSARDDEGNLLDDINDPRVQEVLVQIPTAVSWADLPGCDEFDLSKLPIEAQWGLYMQVQRHYTGHNTSATLEFRENEIDKLSTLIYQDIKEQGGYISAALLARFDANETFPRLPFEPVDKDTYSRWQWAVKVVREIEAQDVDFLEILNKYDKEDYELKGAAGCDSAKCLSEDTSKTG